MGSTHVLSGLRSSGPGSAAARRSRSSTRTTARPSSDLLLIIMAISSTTGRRHFLSDGSPDNSRGQRLSSTTSARFAERWRVIGSRLKPVDSRRPIRFGGCAHWRVCRRHCSLERAGQRPDRRRRIKADARGPADARFLRHCAAVIRVTRSPASRSAWWIYRWSCRALTTRRSGPPLPFRAGICEVTRTAIRRPHAAP